MIKSLNFVADFFIWSYRELFVWKVPKPGNLRIGESTISTMWKFGHGIIPHVFCNHTDGEWIPIIEKKCECVCFKDTKRYN